MVHLAMCLLLESHCFTTLFTHHLGMYIMSLSILKIYKEMLFTCQILCTYKLAFRGDVKLGFIKNCDVKL